MMEDNSGGDQILAIVRGRANRFAEELEVWSKIKML